MNTRGNTYGRMHEDPSKNADNFSDEFWNFSWDDIGKYDTPAIIDKVLEISGKPKLYYIGTSQGSTTMLICLAENPSYNSKIIVASLMPPAAYGNNVGPTVLLYFYIFLLLWVDFFFI